MSQWRTLAEFAEATGLSTSLIDDVENGRRTRFRPSTIAAIEGALRWAPGSIQRILEGGQPVPLPDELWERLRAAWAGLPPDARRVLVELAESGILRR